MLVPIVFAFGEAIAAPASVPEQPNSRPALLGREEAALREEFGAALQSQTIDRRHVLNPGKIQMPSDAVGDEKDVGRAEAPADVKDPFVDQQRLMRHIV